MDPVTNYLTKLGVDIKPAYFGSSNYEWGKCWDTPQWTLIYRLDENALTVCEFTSKDKASGISSAVLQMVEQLKRLKKNVAEVSNVRGRVLLDNGSAQERERHQVFHDILLKQGAKEIDQEDGSWIVY
ncbi:secretion protein [Parashewanella spongiae]|uniref:Secretion protein n=1 Tax=Parashewanella spongiae TaxID=342950 RepID=A0A3A6TP85_9GAMM|nr:secretion protein [Parashewanella spongiae]MCL1078524.1 secretion protein [Parashewanella spongiae]RJY13457.1 secretion protein [Parashewanella spongiae]